jgi:hypothetical protein
MRPPKERETAITQSSENHKAWEVWTDDPYWQRRLDHIATGRPSGSGRNYTLRADQVLLRKGKPQRTAMMQYRFETVYRHPGTPEQFCSELEFTLADLPEVRF